MEKQNMYLLLKDDEKTIVETIKELENMNIDGYEIYSLARVDTSELIFDAEIRDTIYRILKGEQMPKDDVIERVKNILDIGASRVSKVISKMKKEKVVYSVDDLWVRNGNKWIGIE